MLVFLSRFKQKVTNNLARALFAGLLAAAAIPAPAAETETFGQVNRIAISDLGILVLGVGGTFCFMTDGLADDSVSAMSAVLAAAVANELDIQPNTLNSAWMTCDAALFIENVGMCRAGVNPASGTQCF